LNPIRLTNLQKKYLDMKKIITSQESPEAIGPYSQAIRAGDFLYVSGQIALDHVTGELKMNTIAEEVECVLKNLCAVLKAGGALPKDVIKCSVFLADMSLFAQFNTYYAQVFEDLSPARETVAVSGLPKGVRVEISAIAYLPLN
jgi:2-iminobutanoate/2-iminopropanoate deaminase|tara:strand:- start:162 stop:593 length:432 start_codon:yes stop_codon:yes gene_type:complete